MIDTALYQIVTGNAAITTKFGTNIYVNFCPDPTDLYLVILQVGHARPATIDNVPSKQSARFQLDVYGKSSPAVSAAAQTLVDELNFTGDTSHGHSIQLMRIDDERAGYESDTKLFRKSIDISLFFD